MAHLRCILAFIALALPCVGIGTGCIRAGELRYGPDPRDISAETVDLRFLHRAERRGPRVFQRVDLLQSREPATRYVRGSSVDGRSEGSLRGIGGSLRAAVESETRAAQPLPWPAESAKPGHAFLFEFDPPVAEWPAKLIGGQATTAEVRIRTFDRLGRWFTDATGSRITWLEGRESLFIGGREYPRCLRLQGVTHIRFGWWCSIEFAETIWAHERFGIVRRDERLSGVAMLVVGFGGAYRYDLMPGVEPLNGHSSSCPGGEDAPLMRRLAVALDRGLPHPRVGGLIVEFEPSAP